MISLAVGAASAAAACSATPTVLPSRDFDRPTDMVFVCMGAFDPGAAGVTPADGGQAAEPDGGASSGLQVSGRPMDQCHPIGDFDPPSDGQHRTFAFIPNSSSGQLAVVDTDRWKLVDLDPAVAGYNQAPLGVLPEQIAASDDGCRLVTANRGSCDLTLVDPAALMAPTLAAATPGISVPTPSTVSQTIMPRTGAGQPLEVAPYELLFLPQDTSTLTSGHNLCGREGTTTPVTPWKALVTFPSCDLIAIVELPSGVILDSVKVHAAADRRSITFEPTGANPICAADCGGARGLPPPDAGQPEAAAPEAGAAPPDAADDDAAAGGADGATPPGDGGAQADAGASAGQPLPAGPYLGPSALAILPGGTRAYVGLANAPFIVSLGLTPGGALESSPKTIELHEGAVGTRRIRLSVSPYERDPNGKTLGRFVGAQTDRHYLYAIARDGTVRVVHLPSFGDEIECETNVDPQSTSSGMPVDLGSPCVPASGPAHRRPFTFGPGIRLPTVPIDVATADVRLDPSDAPAGATGVVVREGTVSGAYAWVLTSNGVVYLVNIDPVARAYLSVPDADPPGGDLSANVQQLVAEALPPPNTLRDRNILSFSRTLDSSSGPPRLDLPPVVPTLGPRLEAIWARGTDNNGTALTADYLQTHVLYPDRRAVTPQAWSVTWEGPLFDPRFSGQITAINDPAGLDFTFEDRGMNFCRFGVKPGDMVSLYGCVNDNQCGLGKVCIRGSGAATEGAGGLAINGICADSNAAGTQTTACAALLGAVRRYEVTRTGPTALALRPHRDELVRPRLYPCQPAPGSGAGGPADAGADAGAGQDDCVDDADPATKGFKCSADRRCLQPCTPGSPSTCRAGRTCVAFEDGGFCADAPPIDVHCFPELFAYQVEVGHAFLVVGSARGLPLTGIDVPDPSDATARICAPDTTLGPRVVARISMDAPHCAGTGNPNLDGDNTFDSRCHPQPSNPSCTASAAAQLDMLRTAPAPTDACLFVGGPNDTDLLTQSPTHVHALFRNTEIAFMMTNLERAPSNALAIRFDVHGGFLPQTVRYPPTVEVSAPARIMLGPFDSRVITNTANPNKSEVPYLFVVDQRRLGRSQGGGPTRGQILRINPLGFPNANLSLEPIYEDFSRSSNLFPIQ